MQNRKGTRWAVWGLLVICLGQALYIYMSAPSRPEPTKVASVTKVGEGGAIYEVLYDSGGATVPYVYRYFLMDLQRSDEDALKKLKKTTPFLVTKSTGAVRGVLGDRVKLKTEEAIYDFHNIGYFKVNGELSVVKFDMDSTVP